jgi:hypothetical protein
MDFLGNMCEDTLHKGENDDDDDNNNNNNNNNSCQRDDIGTKNNDEMKTCWKKPNNKFLG